MELSRARKAPKAAGPFVPAPPRVNVLPPASRERAAARKAKRASLTAFGLSVLTVGGLWGNGFLVQVDQKGALAEAKEAQATLATEMAVYAPVTNVAAQSNSLTQTVQAQTQKEVLHAEVLSRFVEAVGDVGSVQSVSLATGEGAAACTSTDPFNEVPRAGCLTFAVKSATGQAGAATLISNLSAQEFFVDPFIPSTPPSSGEVVLNGTVGVSEAVYASQATALREGEN